MLEIIHATKNHVAINKPPGLLVHPSSIARDADTSALQQLRDQIGQYVYPVHRLDRKTSGVLLFALNKESQILLNKAFQNGNMDKEYLAIVRGHIADSGIIDYELTNEKNKTQQAVTHFKCLQKTEIDLPHGKHQTSRYSLVHLIPKTGRHHQLRKHMAHIFHPIIGDRPHGCNKQNKLFKENFDLMEMLLHATELSFQDPQTGESVLIRAKQHGEFERMRVALNFSDESL